MKLYKDRNNKREIQCGYCLHEGHNKRNCPTMKKQWDANADLQALSRIGSSDTLNGVDVTMFPSAYANYYGDSQAEQQFRAYFQYMKSRYEPKTSTKKEETLQDKVWVLWVYCPYSSKLQQNEELYLYLERV